MRTSFSSNVTLYHWTIHSQHFEGSWCIFKGLEV